MRRRRIAAASLTEKNLNFEKQTYAFEELCEGVFTYIDERYRGSFKIEKEYTLHGDVFICKDAICYLVRLLLNELFGRTLLHVSCGQRIDQTFYLSFTYDSDMTFTTSASTRVLAYAKRAGVRLESFEEDGRITLLVLMPFKNASFEMVYAPVPQNVFFYALHDIDLPLEYDREAVNPDGELWHLPSKKKY